MTEKRVIEALYAFIAEGEEGEVMCAFDTGTGWMPMVAADLARVDQLRQVALIALTSGRCIKLHRFTAREELEVICRD